MVVIVFTYQEIGTETALTVFTTRATRKVSESKFLSPKLAGVVIPDAKWVAMMRAELDAGSWKVIAEAREGGNIGIYNQNHSANTQLIDTILKEVKSEDVIWEAPLKNQQAWFINLLGANVNLGNIAPNEVIALEALRVGLRGDTFFNYIPKA